MNDAGAVEQALSHIEKLIAEGFCQRDQDWLDVLFDHDLRLTPSAPYYVTLPISQVEPLIERTRTERAAFDVAKYVVATRLSADVALPTDFREFAARVLSGEQIRPPGKAGRKRNSGRDFIIVDAMRLLLGEDPLVGKADRSPTENPVPRGKRRRVMSAARIVARALSKSNIDAVDIKRIENIWSQSKSTIHYFEARKSYHQTILDDIEGDLRI